MKQNNKFKQTGIKDLIKNNAILRYKILAFLYLVNQENKKTSWEGLANRLKVQKEEIKSNLKFLKNEKLIGYPQDINENPILAWGQRGGIFIKSKGGELIGEIGRKRDEGKGELKSWALNNASWIVPAISHIFKLFAKSNG